MNDKYLYVYTDVDDEIVPFTSLDKAWAFANVIISQMAEPPLPCQWTENTDFKIRRIKLDPTFNEWLDSHTDE